MIPREQMIEGGYSGDFRPSRSVVGVASALLIATPLANRKGLFIQNLSDSIIYIDDTTATVAASYPIQVGCEFFLHASALKNIYAISSGATKNVAILEVA